MLFSARDLAGFLVVSCLGSSLLPVASAASFDVVIYGNTVAAASAAIQARRMNATVAIVFPGKHFGGLTVSGLGWTDSKDGNTVGGIGREFYQRLYNHYKKSGAWKHGTRSQYVGKKMKAQPGKAIDDSKKIQWTFEPKAAEAVLEDWLKSAKITIVRNERIDRSSKNSVVKSGTKIKSFRTESGKVFSGKMFIDAGYEGDLMAMAGISFTSGREGTSERGESLAGVRFAGNSTISKVDPYKKKGKKSSGLLFGITRSVTNAGAEKGKRDVRLQSFNFRLTLTKEASNRVPFSKPAGYKASDYELLLRYIEAGYKGPFFTSSLMPNGKTDTNAKGEVSTDLPGGNFDSNSNYADWSYAKRKSTYEAHKKWTQGFFYTLITNKRVPASIRSSVAKWGYAKDEYTDNGNWPYELYVREARRMIGKYVMTQADIQKPKAPKGDTVASVASYSLDVHEVERVALSGGVRGEGLVHEAIKGPFYVPYNSIVPKASEVTNFLNPVTLSASHVAFGSIRMEPTYMTLGQTAGTAAVLAIKNKVNVQDVNRSSLTKRLKADKQVLTL